MKIPLDAVLNFEALSATLIFANTPTYVYTHFQNDSSVRTLAASCNASEILADLQEILSKPIEQLPEAVKAYALLVSLSYKQAYELARVKKCFIETSGVV